MVFNPNVTLSLIEKVKQYPILYDMSLPEYKSIRRKKMIWKIIAEELGEASSKAKLLRTKWTTLRATYYKHLRNLKITDEDGCNKHRQWRWAPYMSFLDDYINTENVMAGELDEESEEISHSYIEGPKETDTSEGDLIQFVEIPIMNTIEIDSGRET